MAYGQDDDTTPKDPPGPISCRVQLDWKNV